MGEQKVSWLCGRARAEALVIGNRIGGYRYVVVGGCGKYNPPNKQDCWNCGRAKQK